jgi:hypothetical protein
MAAKQDVRTLLRKQLGKDVADAMLNKVDAMAKRGVSADKIEKAFVKDLNAHVEKRVGDLVGTAVRAVSGVRQLVLVAVRSKGVAVRPSK